MKFSIIQAVFKAEGLPYLEKHVLTYLAYYTDERLPTSQAVYPGLKALMSKTGIQDKKTLIKHLSTLEEKRYIIYAGRCSRTDSYTFNDDILHFNELEAEYKQKKPTRYHQAGTYQQTNGSLALDPARPARPGRARSLSVVPSIDEGDPLGDLQEYEQGSPSPAGDHQGPGSLDLVEQVTRSSVSPGTALSPSLPAGDHQAGTLPAGDQVEQGSPLPGHQVTRPGINEPWSPTVMVALAGSIAGRVEYTHDEYERELQAAKIILTLKPEHTDYKPIDRATFETAYTFEHTKGTLARKKGRALSLRDFENMTTLDMAIRLSREESAKRQEKQQKTPTFIEGAGHIGRDVDTVLPLGQAEPLTPEKIEQRRIALQKKLAEIASKRREITPVIRPGRVERQRTNHNGL